MFSIYLNAVPQRLENTFLRSSFTIWFTSKTCIYYSEYHKTNCFIIGVTSRRIKGRNKPYI